MIDALIVVAAFVAVALAAVFFAASVHFTWLAKERLLVRLATRVGVPYEVRQPWWIRWVR